VRVTLLGPVAASANSAELDRLITQARHVLNADGAVGAAPVSPLPEQALALWTGEPLAGLQVLRFAREEAARLTERLPGPTWPVVQRGVRAQPRPAAQPVAVPVA
jgi:hypothetical protein